VFSIHQLTVAVDNHALDVTTVLKRRFVLDLLLASFAAIRVFFRCRAATAVEVVALRQQLAVLKRKRPRPPLTSCDRLFWITLRRFWSRWKVPRLMQGAGMIRLQPNGRVVILNGAIQVAFVMARNTPVVEGAGVVRLQPNGRVVIRGSALHRESQDRLADCEG
jgi:hypothetical protein